MYHLCRPLPRALLSVVLLVLSGCAKTPPTRFYVLPALTGARPRCRRWSSQTSPLGLVP
jgi:uncharacterized lipoprotein YmbA